ncbi:MAG: ATP-dependent helicase [Epsilonproteobacteria bacterium]|nr:MAG: ATP-dependent helicase [Campylobacterota bacterium]RLA65698.1 MAG: ATP-dependent helicase [Campylobacterota bacterium]
MEFKDLGLGPDLLKALDGLGYVEPTEIQERAIPILLERNSDFIGQAQTGTGKTAAFALPLLQVLNPDSNSVQALVVCPTRELANQVCAEIDKIAKFTKFKTLAIYGGASYIAQKRSLIRDRPQIVVGTPGRLQDLMKQGVLQFHNAEYVVLDEADEMLNMGFFEDVQNIIAAFDKNRRIWMFSATMPKPILNLINKEFDHPKTVSIKKKTLSNDDIEQRYYTVMRKYHKEALCRILDTEPDTYALIFCRTKMETRELADVLLGKGHRVETLNGDMGQRERDVAMERFKAHKVDLMVCTDVAARGIDVNNLTHVINFGVPQDNESYVHRIGRTGRAGLKGISITLVDPKDQFIIKKIERFTNKQMIKAKLPSVNEIKSSVVTTELENIRGLVETILEKGDEFKLDDTYKIMEECFEDFEKDELLKVMFTWKFNKKLLALDNIGNLDSIKRGNGSSKDNVRLFMSVGKTDGLTLKILLDDVSHKFGLKKSDIQNVDMKTNFSFLEVPTRFRDKLLKSKDLRIRSRKVRFEVSQARN